MDCPQKQQNPVLLFLPPKGHTTFWLVELGLFPHYAFIWHKKDRFCYGGKPNYHPIPTYKVHPIKWGHSGGGPWAVVKLRWSARVWPRGCPKARSWVRWSALGTLASPKALRGAWGQEVRKGEGEKPRCVCLSMSLFALIFQQQNRKFVNWRQIKLIETPHQLKTVLWAWGSPFISSGRRNGLTASITIWTMNSVVSELMNKATRPSPPSASMAKVLPLLSTK